MKLIYGLTAICIALPMMGCASNTALIAEKDAEIAKLQTEVAGLKKVAKATPKESDNLNETLRNELADLRDREKILIEKTNNATSITVPNGALFESGSVKLSPKGKTAIDRVWTILAKYPNRQIFIEGHTDSVPIKGKLQGQYKSNWELSTARAQSVMNYVLAKPGAKPGRLVIAGFGEYRPAADNSTEAGRSKNRRVVITVRDPLVS